MRLTESSNSLIGNERLISKIYFPRLIIPASSVITSFIDFLDLLCHSPGTICYLRLCATGRDLPDAIFWIMAVIRLIRTRTLSLCIKCQIP